MEWVGAGLVLTLVIGWLSELFLIVAWSRPAFQTGRVMVDRAEPWSPARAVPVGVVVSTDNGKFKFVTPRLCLFRGKFRFFAVRLHTPFPLKGAMELGEAGVRVCGRLPVAPFAFLLAWLAMWTVFPVVGAFHGVGRQGPVEMVWFVLLGWATAAVIYYVSVWVERKRLLGVYGELKDWLGTT